MNKVMKELKKPKVLIVTMLLMIYVLSKVETREGHRGRNEKNHRNIHKDLVTKEDLGQMNKKIYDGVEKLMAKNI